MLGFFRRFQKGIFIGITVAIVISFSFFGSYSLVEAPVRDEVVFKAVDGTEVKRSEIEWLATFLSTDALDQLNWGTPVGPNFLNDGVVRNDFLKVGLGRVLFQNFYSELREEWEGKWKRERGFQAYRHPEVPYFSADGVWSHFAPGLKKAFKEFKAGSLEDPVDLFDKKVALYLAEGEFSEQKLKQVLYFQMQQAKWMKPDRSLQHQNLSLFGYKSLNDWFGQDFLRLSASFIWNAALVAEREGYRVSLDEAVEDLKGRALSAFETQRQNPAMTFGDPSQYLREQLRYLGMDLGQAALVWQRVLLFRKMFYDLGSSVMVAKRPFEPFVDHVSKQVEVATYRLPEAVQLKDFRQLQRFEAYVGALSLERVDGVPLKWKREDEVAAEHPELMMKRYLVDVKEVDPKGVAGRIGLKQLWQWQVSDGGWERLVREFSFLGVSMASGEEERFDALDHLDEMTRERVDGKSRLWMVEEHPEWIEEALVSAPFERRTLYFYKKGGKGPLRGLSDPEKALAMLDLPELSGDNFPLVTLRDVGEKTWQVKVYDRSMSWEIASFEEAERDGVLEEKVAADLAARYEELKGESALYQLADGTYKPFSDVRDTVAQEVFRKEMNRIKRSMGRVEGTGVIDEVASYKMKAYLESRREELLKCGERESDLVRGIVKAVGVQEGGERLPLRGPLEDQFKLVREEAVWDRSQQGLGQPFASVLAIEPNTISEVIRRPNGDLIFFKIIGTKSEARGELLGSMLKETKEDLSASLQLALTRRLLKEFKEKEALKRVAFKGDRVRREM